MKTEFKYQIAFDKEGNPLGYLISDELRAELENKIK